MSNFYNSPFYLKPTAHDYLFKVIFKGRFIGHIDERNEGTFIIQTNKIFDKFKAFGLDREVLECESIKFHSVLVIFNDKKYIAPKKRFLESGKSQIYPDGEKLYLNLRYFNLPSNHQNQLNLFQGG